MLRHDGDAEAALDEVEQRVDVVDAHPHAALEVPGAERVVGEPPDRPLLPEVDEVAVDEVLPGDLGGRGERVGRVREQHDRAAAELEPAQGAEVLGGRDERDVEVARPHLRGELARPRLGELDVHERVAQPEPLEQRRDVDHAEALLGPEPQAPRELVARPHDGVAARGGLGEHPPRERQQRPPGVRQRDLPRGAREQVGAELALEVADRGGQAGLRDAAERRGVREVALLRHRDEVLHLPQLH